MPIITRVVASIRGRKDRLSQAIIYACVNQKCHPATIKRGQKGENYKCEACHRSLRPILEIFAKQNERITVSVQNIAEGVSFIFITRHSLSSGKKKKEKFFLHRGKLQHI